MKYAWLLLLLCHLQARENPFFPSENVDSSGITSNIITSYPPLERAAITLPDQARVLESVEVTYKNLDGSIDKKSIQVGQSIDWHLPLFISQSYGQAKSSTPQNAVGDVQEKVSFDFVTIEAVTNVLTIKTGDKNLRNFMLVDPHRIVMDFEREANFLSFEKKLKTLPFTDVRIGNHDGYYRVVIALDGHYRFETEKIPSGYRITLY